MLNRLSDSSLKLRVGMGVGVLAGAGSAWFNGWDLLTLFIAIGAGAVAAYLVDASQR